MIKELLETRIRPAVMEDGGDIVFKVRLLIVHQSRLCSVTTVDCLSRASQVHVHSRDKCSNMWGCATVGCRLICERHSRKQLCCSSFCLFRPCMMMAITNFLPDSMQLWCWALTQMTFDTCWQASVFVICMTASAEAVTLLVRAHMLWITSDQHILCLLVLTSRAHITYIQYTATPGHDCCLMFRHPCKH